MTIKKVYTSGEVADMLNIPARTARRYVTNGKIKATQNPITGTWTITHDALQQFVKENKIDPSVLARPRRVLIVDDDPHLVLMLTRTLKHHDPKLEVEFSHNGYEAIMKIGALEPELICLDIQMPGVDGLELLQVLKSNEATANVKILVMTGHPDRLDEMLTLGADEALVKPFEPERLLDMIGKLLKASPPDSGGGDVAAQI